MAKRRNASIANSCRLHDGLAALPKAHQNKINTSDLKIDCSADIDACLQPSEPNANRWDYFVDTEKHGEFYLEVHEVSEEHLSRLIEKAAWLTLKISALSWPATSGRSYFVAPTKGIFPFATFGALSLRLAAHKMVVVHKGDRLVEQLE